MAKTTRTRSQVAKRNVEAGKRAERDTFRWLAAHGFPGAARLQRTGHRTRHSTAPDEGDGKVTCGIAWQVKYYTTGSWPVQTWLHQTEQQRLAAGADLGVLVIRQPGKADPGRWIGVIRNDAEAALLGAVDWPEDPTPVRRELRDLVVSLRRAGRGEPLTDQALAELRGQAVAEEDAEPAAT